MNSVEYAKKGLISMYVTNKQMYHFKNNNHYNEIWQPGNEITIDDNYLSAFYQNCLYSTPSVITKDNKEVTFYKIIDNYLKEEQNSETYIRLLKEASIILKNYANTKRELVLEEYRKKFYPNLPSRKNSIWLATEKQLDFWEKTLLLKETKGKLFKVEVTGNLFKSSDLYIPDDELSVKEIYEYAEKYWNPNLTNIDEEKTEYLFQGNLKILTLEKQY